MLARFRLLALSFMAVLVAPIIAHAQMSIDTTKGNRAVDDVSQAENKTRSETPYDNSIISEKNMIRNQFMKCWVMPAPSPNPETLIVKVRVVLGVDGTVAEAKLAADQGRYHSDPFFRAVADSAIRAVWKCAPLQNLPSDKYDSWRDMELTFDPQELM